MRVGLRVRMIVPLAVLLLGDAVATAWAARSAARQAERRIALQLAAVAHTLTEPPTFPLAPRVLAQMKGLSGAEFLLVRADGSRLSTFADTTAMPPADSANLADASDPEADLGPPIAVGAQAYRCRKLPLRQQPNEGGTLYIFYPEELRRTAVRDAVLPPILLGGTSGLFGIGLVWLTSRRVVQRIRELDRQTRAIAAGDFTPAAIPSQNDELRDLARGVNDMARRLAELQAALQRAERLRVLGQFSGGLAHQLRNAAAGAKLAIQLSLADQPPADREPLDVALRQLARIETNLQQFLDLGRPNELRPQPCDLSRIVTEAVELLRPQCRHAGTAVTWHPPDGPAPFLGDANQLGHLFLNVIGNAVEAAGAGGTVNVQLAHDDSAWLITVTDTGPGPPPEIAERLFDAFVTGKDQGIGLGLAVAKQAVELHAGRIAWDRSAGTTRFRIWLPGGRTTGALHFSA